MVAVGGLYNSDRPVWPTLMESTNNPDELETITGLPAPETPGWALAVTILRPQMSQWTGNAATEGVLFRAVKDATHHVTVKWKPQNFSIEITSVNGAASNTFTLPFGHWFRTQPLTLIISDDGMKIEASALSPRLGVVTGVDADGTLGAAPTSVEMFEPGKVFGLEVAGIAYTTEFLDTGERQESLANLEFLLVE